MVIRCHIRWDLLLLRAQKLVARSGFVVGMQSIQSNCFLSMSLHVDMKPRALIMQSHIFLLFPK